MRNDDNSAGTRQIAKRNYGFVRLAVLSEVEEARRRKRASQGVLRLGVVSGCCPTSSGSAVVLRERANNMLRCDELSLDDSVLGEMQHFSGMDDLKVDALRTMGVYQEAHFPK